MLVDAVLQTGRQEDDGHCDAEASGAILLNLHTERRVVILYSFVVILIGLYYVRIPLSFGEILIKLLKNLCRNYMKVNDIISAFIYIQRKFGGLIPVQKEYCIESTLIGLPKL